MGSAWDERPGDRFSVDRFIRMHLRDSPSAEDRNEREKKMSVLHMLKSATDTICESFIYEDEGLILVIDGGFETESETLYRKLRMLGGRVTGWLFTHPHSDHVGAFCRLMEDHGDEIRVDAIYRNFLQEELLCEYEPREAENTRKYFAWIEQLVHRYRIQEKQMCTGDVHLFGEAKLHVLREPDPSITVNCINNSSVVFRLDVHTSRVLFLGDLGTEGGEQLLECVPDEELKADFVQMAHHGQHGVERPVYEMIRPRCCLWCTPTWLWDNIGPDGYDSGVFHTIVVRGWMSEMGVRRHYMNTYEDSCIVM